VADIVSTLDDCVIIPLRPDGLRWDFAPSGAHHASPRQGKNAASFKSTHHKRGRLKIDETRLRTQAIRMIRILQQAQDIRMLQIN